MNSRRARALRLVRWRFFRPIETRVKQVHDMMKVTGRCLCGAVTYSAQVEKPRLLACHCGMCQQWSGGVSLTTRPVVDIEFTGEDRIQYFASSSLVERGFCSVCGSNLVFRTKRTATEIAICSGTLDDASGFELRTEIYVDSKARGYSFSGDHRRLTEAEFLELMA